MGGVSTVLSRLRGGPLIRLIVIVGLLCLLPIISFVAAEVNPFVALAVCAAPIGAFAVLRKIELGFVAMLLAAVFVRFRIPTGTASEIVMSLLLCMSVFGLWVVRMMVEDKRISLEPTSINTPVLGFATTVVVSLIWSRAFRDPLVHTVGSFFVPYAATVVMILLPVTSLMVVNIVKDIRWLQAAVWAFLFAGLVSLGISLMIDLGIGPANTIRGLVFYNGFLWINTQGLYSLWYLALASAMALFNRRLHWVLRAALVLYALGWIYWGFGLRITWLSGWVPALVAAAVIVFLRSKKLFVVLMVIMVLGVAQYYLQTSYDAETQESGVTRLAAYRSNWRVTGKHLLFGTGPAGYASYYMSYFPTQAMASHSNYIDIIAQTGIVGSFFIVWFFGAQAWNGYKLGQQLQGRGDFAEGLTVAILAGTAGCVVAMGLGDWLLPFVWTQGIMGFDGAVINWFFMGALWSLRYCLAQDARLKNTHPRVEGVAG